MIEYEVIGEILKEELDKVDEKIKSIKTLTEAEIKDIALDIANTVSKSTKEITDTKIKSIKTLCPKDVEAISKTVAEESTKEVLTLVDEKIKSIELTKGDNGIDGAKGLDGAGVDSPMWEEGIYRVGTFVTHNMGQYFKALKDTNTEPGMSEDWERIGKGGLRFTDTFKKDHKYEIGDIFIKDYSLFLHTESGTKLIAKSGRDGKTGSKGEVGKQGKPGKDAVVNYNHLLSQVDDTVQKALVDTMTTVETDKVPLNYYRGLYKPSIKYGVGDVALYMGKLVVAKKASKGKLPNDNKYWESIVITGGGIVPVTGGGGGGIAPADQAKLDHITITKDVSLDKAILDDGSVTMKTSLSIQGNDGTPAEGFKILKGDGSVLGYVGESTQDENYFGMYHGDGILHKIQFNKVGELFIQTGNFRGITIQGTHLTFNSKEVLTEADLPTMPTADGDYKLHVAGGVATWVTI